MKPKAKLNAKRTELQITLPCDLNNWDQVNKKVFDEMIRTIGELCHVKILLDEASKLYKKDENERVVAGLNGKESFENCSEMLQESLIRMMAVANSCQRFFETQPAEPYYR